jgi:hypothetical protein
MVSKENEMSKRKRDRNHKSGAEVEQTESERLNLRMAAPVKRVMGKITVAVDSLARDYVKLESWGEKNELAKVAAKKLSSILNTFPALNEVLEQLDASGFSPPRLSYTSSVVEGDRVSVLETHRHLYDDVMSADLMLNLGVVKKHPGKGGGLVVENSNGNRMKVAISHVVKL